MHCGLAQAVSDIRKMGCVWSLSWHALSTSVVMLAASCVPNGLDDRSMMSGTAAAMSVLHGLVATLASKLPGGGSSLLGTAAARTACRNVPGAAILAYRSSPSDPSDSHQLLLVSDNEVSLCDASVVSLTERERSPSSGASPSKSNDAVTELLVVSSDVSAVSGRQTEVD